MTFKDQLSFYYIKMREAEQRFLPFKNDYYRILNEELYKKIKELQDELDSYDDIIRGAKKIIAGSKAVQERIAELATLKRKYAKMLKEQGYDVEYLTITKKISDLIEKTDFKDKDIENFKKRVEEKDERVNK